MKKTALAFAVTALAATPALVSAQDYQVEGNINYSNVDPDVSGADSTDFYTVSGTYHLMPVRTAGHPLAEAAFLERSSNLFASYNYEDETPYTDTIRVGSEIYMQDFYGAVEVHHVESYGGPDSSNTGAALTGGFVPMDGLLLTLGYSFDEPAAGQEDVLSIGGKFVQHLQAGQAFNLEGRYDIVDDDLDTTVLDLRGDYYLNNAASVGLGMTYSDNDVDDNTAITFGGRMFFTPLMSAALDYTLDSAAAGPGVEADVLSVTLSARF